MTDPLKDFPWLNDKERASHWWPAFGRAWEKIAGQYLVDRYPWLLGTSRPTDPIFTVYYAVASCQFREDFIRKGRPWLPGPALRRMTLTPIDKGPVK